MHGFKTHKRWIYWTTIAKIQGRLGYTFLLADMEAFDSFGVGSLYPDPLFGSYCLLPANSHWVIAIPVVVFKEPLTV